MLFISGFLNHSLLFLTHTTPSPSLDVRSSDPIIHHSSWLQSSANPVSFSLFPLKFYSNTALILILGDFHIMSVAFPVFYSLYYDFLSSSDLSLPSSTTNSHSHTAEFLKFLHLLHNLCSSKAPSPSICFDSMKSRVGALQNYPQYP